MKNMNMKNDFELSQRLKNDLIKYDKDVIVAIGLNSLYAYVSKKKYIKLIPNKFENVEVKAIYMGKVKPCHK